MRYKDVKRIIDNWDPMFLWSCGCPPDEYDFESRDIWEAILNNYDLDSLTDLIFNRFEQDQTMDSCRTIAEKLLKQKGGRTVLCYYCPLLKREITEIYCSDINMVAFGSISPKQKTLTIKDRIDTKIVKSICLSCDYLYWQKEDLNFFYIQSFCECSYT